jgi:DNA repair exonuclease SbcCD nuclease subunit
MTENLKDVKRIIMSTDWHFGARSNSLEWFEIMKNHFDDFFIPWLKENVQPGDVLYQLGDVFDNRQNVNLLIGNYVIELFEKLGKILPVYIIVGNHDIYRKHTNDVTSVDMLKWIPNIHVYKEPIVHRIGKMNCLLMPWRRNEEHEQETIMEHPGMDYLFCHSEVRGSRLSPNPVVKHDGGNEITTFKKFKRVYSGHIHYAQIIKNFNFIGNPYQMTRSDRGNKKGIWILDVASGAEEFVENTYSPKFLKFNISELYDMSLSEVKDLFKNNFIDLQIPTKLVSSYNISLLMNLLDGIPRKIDPDMYEDEDSVTNESVEISIDESGSDFNIISISKRFIESSGYDDEIKKRLYDSIQSLYDKLNQ